MSLDLKTPNNACTRLGVGPAFFESFLAHAESRFDGESTLPPQAGNAHRWAASGLERTVETFVT